MPLPAKTCLVLALLLAAQHCGRPCCAADPNTAARLTAAWRAIEARYERFECRWTADVTYMAGSLSGPDGRRIPTNDVVYPMSYRMACEGKKVRFSKEGIEYDPADRHDFMMNAFVNTFDGQIQHRVFLNSKYAYGGTGFISEIAHCDMSGDSIEPATLAFRPLAAGMEALNVAEFDAPVGRQTIKGVECDRFDIPLSRSRNVGRNSYYVARTADARIVRHEAVVQGQLRKQLTLDYQEDPSGRHVMTGFVFAEWSQSGALMLTRRCAEVSVELKPKFARDELRYVFPKGIGVLHEQTGALAIARADGTLRFVSNGELDAGIPWEELMRTDPPPEATFFLRRPSLWSTRTMLVAVCAGSLTLGASYHIRRRRREAR
jgi:hypothetical protein